MDLGGKYNSFGIELLTQSNYKISRTCMEFHLVGEDLWDVVGGDNTEAPQNDQKHGDAFKK